MIHKHITLIAHELSLKEWQVEHTIQLLEEGGTIPLSVVTVKR